mmetsp:Transcript_13360/g.31250  ORF Transcript_13360/g.31250 Transcript_13360/m.31250 type:complete len:251 (-) Transcript_13360:2054-2806(-)
MSCGLEFQSPAGNSLSEWLCFIGLGKEELSTPSTVGLYDDCDDNVVEVGHSSDSSETPSRKLVYAETSKRTSGMCVDCARGFQHCTCGDANTKLLPVTCDTPGCSHVVCSDCLRCRNHCTCLRRHSHRDWCNDDSEDESDNDSRKSETICTKSSLRGFHRDGIASQFPSGTEIPSTSEQLPEDLLRSFQTDITLSSAVTARVSNSVERRKALTNNRRESSAKTAKALWLKRSRRQSQTSLRNNELWRGEF